MRATTPLYARADRLLFAVFATCGAAAVALSLHFGGTVLALAVAIPLVAVAASLVAAQPGRPVTRLSWRSRSTMPPATRCSGSAGA